MHHYPKHSRYRNHRQKKTNIETWLSNATIDIDENINPYFAGSIIDNDTGNFLEFSELKNRQVTNSMDEKLF